MIEVNNITKKFGSKTALDQVTFNLYDGEIVALIGENGAGKSTLMRIICGYIPASAGIVKVYEHNVQENRIQALKNIGYVPEISSLYGEMYVYDFLKWMAGIWNIQEIDTAIKSAAKRMKIVEVLDERIENLSKGFKKRVEIASAILHSPKFLVLDEPTDGLDPNQKFEIREFVKQYVKDHIVLISTHVLEDIDVAGRVIMLSHGKIIKDTDINNFKKISKRKDLSEAFRILSQPGKEQL